VRRLVPLVVLLVLAVGCDTSKPGEKTVSPLPVTVQGTVPQVKQAPLPAVYKHGDSTAGKQVFQTAGCSGCHTLAQANAHGTVGPNLDSIKPALSIVVHQVVNGGAVMPAFKGRLSTKQIADVSAFVVKATGGNSNG